MRNGVKRISSIFLASFVISTVAIAQDVNIEFESYGSCPIRFVPGTDDYDLCQAQQRQDEMDNGDTGTLGPRPTGDVLQFNVRETNE